MVQHNEDFFYHNKSNDGYRAVFYSPQRFYGRLREHLILSGISQYFECLKERNEERNGARIHKRQEGIFEVYFKVRGVRVPALDVGLPKQESESADTDEHNYYLQKRR
jgi:hypothetical protein